MGAVILVELVKKGRKPQPEAIVSESNRKVDVKHKSGPESEQVWSFTQLC